MSPFKRVNKTERYFRRPIFSLLFPQTTTINTRTANSHDKSPSN
jgi:hypothetical protein